MVALRTEPDYDDLVWRQLQAAEVHCCLTLIGGKENGHPLPAWREVQDPSQGFVAALHPQPVELGARQLGSVFAASGDDPLAPHRASNVCMVCIGIGKCHDLAVRHTRGSPV